MPKPRPSEETEPGTRRAIFASLMARLVGVIVMALLLVTVAPVGHAKDTAQLKRDVVSATDFRLRVSAALALGKAKDLTAVPALTQALKDSNGAVRASAAAALGSIGDPSAIGALEKAKSSEKEASVKQSIDRAIAALNAAKKTRVLVSVAKLENKSGEPKVSGAFQSAVKAEVARIPGVEMMTSEAQAVAEAKQRKLPTVALDARLTHLSNSNAGNDVAVAAKVELLIRKIPEQSLKATVKGDAKALANSKSVKGDKDLAELREDAVKAAVASALKGAPTAIEAATK